MELKRRTIRVFKEAAKRTKDPCWAETFDKLASYEFNRLENIELVYDNLAINNEWLVLQDLFDDTAKAMDINELITDLHPGKTRPDHNTLELGMKSGGKILQLYNDILEDCERRFHGGTPLIKWLRDQAEEYVELLKTLQKESEQASE
jgi:hypothetical protein